MPRKGAVPKRDVLPDPVYGNKTVTRFINKVMLDGKKGVAEKIVYGAFDICHSKLNKEPIEIFEQALNNVMPVLEVRSALSLCSMTAFFSANFSLMEILPFVCSFSFFSAPLFKTLSIML